MKKHLFLTILLVTCFFQVNAGDEVSEKDFPLLNSTPHYAVRGETDREFTIQVGKVIEGLYDDFFATVGKKYEPQKNLLPLKIYCLDIGRVTKVGKFKLDIMRPGLYKFSNRATSEIYASKKAILQHYGDWAPIRHEAAHQLVHKGIGILPSQKSGELWFHEGMACYFEGTGKFRLNNSVKFMRLLLLVQTYRYQGLPKLDEILNMDVAKANEQGAARTYAVFWSFVHFLFHGEDAAYRKGFLEYIDKLRDKSNKGRAISLFYTIFKDKEKLESSWVKYTMTMMRGGDLSGIISPIESKDAYFPPFKVPEGSVPYVKEEKNSKPKITVTDKNQVLRQLKLISRLKGIKRENKIDDVFSGNRDAIQVLTDILKKNSSRNRKLAAEILGQVGDRLHVLELCKSVLTDSNEDVRMISAQAIRELNEGLAPQGFLDAMKGEDLKTALYAIDGLGEIRDKAAVTPLIHFLKRSVNIKSSLDDSGSTTRRKSYRERTGLKSREEIIGDTKREVAKNDRLSIMNRAIQGNRKLVQFTVVRALQKIVPEHKWTSHMSWLTWAAEKQKE